MSWFLCMFLLVTGTSNGPSEVLSCRNGPWICGSGSASAAASSSTSIDVCVRIKQVKDCGLYPQSQKLRSVLGLYPCSSRVVVGFLRCLNRFTHLSQNGLLRTVMFVCECVCCFSVPKFQCVPSSSYLFISSSRHVACSHKPFVPDELPQ